MGNTSFTEYIQYKIQFYDIFSLLMGKYKFVSVLKTLQCNLFMIFELILLSDPIIFSRPINLPCRVQRTLKSSKKLRLP